MQTNQTDIKEFLSIIQMIADDTTILEKFFNALLTPKELIEIPRRLQIIKQLKNGIPQRIIAKNLRTSIATVTRGAREINTKNNGFDTAFLLCAKKTGWSWQTKKGALCR
ncbi:MAG: Trp family transcriptional regulator [bacterium]